MARLEWAKLLSEKRIRPLLGGGPSIKSSEEKRSEFERDYGRTIYSSPFRRLKHKAQVFPLAESDFVRTRLIHSLEVSSVAEDLATQIVKVFPDRKLPPKQLQAIPLVAATCGLIHDLGNPLFGHAGEQAIASWFERRQKADPCFLSELTEQQKQDFLKFEGNSHALRIVSHLRLVSDRYGLNYTCGTLSASRKYVAASHETRKPPHSRSKPGFFASEQEIVELVASKTGTYNCRHPVTFIVEAADDIVYSVVDLEDGIKRKVLSWDQVQQQLRRKCRNNSILKKAASLAKKQTAGGAASGPGRDDIHAQTFRIAAISEMAIAARIIFMKRYKQIMEGAYEEELLMDKDCEAREFIRACKDVLKENLYTAPEILKLEIRGRRVIHDLMDLFWEAVEAVLRDGKVPGIGSYSWQAISIDF